MMDPLKYIETIVLEIVDRFVEGEVENGRE
jgi:hypothetical protein